MLFACILLACAACTEEGKIADQMKDIPMSKWNYNQIADFAFKVENPNLYHDFYLKLRIQKSYPYENLYLLAHIRDPDGQVKTQRINFTLTDSDGKPLGRVSGNNISYEMPMMIHRKMNEAGQFSIALEQNMRDSVVFGVESIGVKIKEGPPVF